MSVDRFKAEYIKALTESVNKNPDEYGYGASEVPAVADRMIAAILRGSASNSNNLKRVARKLGIEPTMASMRAYLSQGAAHVDNVDERLSGKNITPKTIHTALTILVPLMAQCASEKRDIKAAVAFPKNYDATIKALERLFQREWPRLEIQVVGKTAHISYDAGMSAESIKTFLTHGLKKMLSSSGDAASDVKANAASFPYQYETIAGEKYRSGTLSDNLVTQGMLIRSDAVPDSVKGGIKVIGHGKIDRLTLLTWHPRDNMLSYMDRVKKAVKKASLTYQYVKVVPVKLVAFPPGKPPKDRRKSDKASLESDLNKFSKTKTSAINPLHADRTPFHKILVKSKFILTASYTEDMFNDGDVRYVFDYSHQNGDTATVTYPKDKPKGAYCLMGKKRKDGFHNPVDCNNVSELQAWLKKYHKIDVATNAANDTKEYSITEAKYAKGMMAVHCPSTNGYKTRAARLAAKFSNERYSNRERAYIMSLAAANKFKKAYSDGLEATYDGELYHPDHPNLPSRK